MVLYQRKGHLMANTHEVAVVGGGIVGLAIAWHLVRQVPAIHVTVVEQEDTIGTHQTGHNSGVITSGSN